MMLAFVGPLPSPTHTVDHIAKYDGDWKRERSDNRLENLRYATKKQQTKNRSKSKARIDSRANASNDHAPDNEEFRLVEGMLVSQYGRTKNHYGVIYTPMPNKSMDYALVGSTRKTLHILVATAFPEICGVPSDGQDTVDHIDRNTANNHATNLRWATRTEQQLNTTRQHGSVIVNNLKEAVEVKPPGEENWVRYNSCSDAMRGIQFSHGRFIAAQSMAQLIRRHPEGATIQLRQNAGWSFRCPTV
jgi:hypothetical protein